MSTTLKGKMVIGQSGGPTAVINASLVGAVQTALRRPEIDAVYGMAHGIAGLLAEDFVDLGREDPATLAAMRDVPGAALGACRRKVSAEDYERIVRVLQAHDVRYFFYIGGNDSMDTAHQVGKLANDLGYELRCIGIPKTIDNDLAYTDHCPGYGSVARLEAMMTRGAGLDSEALCVWDKVKLIEVMGRNSGWITAATALARDHEDAAPHLIYMPEIPFTVDCFLDDVQRVYDRVGCCVVTICEGMRDEHGQAIAESRLAVDTDSFGHPSPGGVADELCKIVKSRLKLKARFDKPGTLQRVFGAVVSDVDLDEAYRAGQAAVSRALEGVTDKMVTLVRESSRPYVCSTGLADLAQVANAEKKLPREFIAPSGHDVTEAFLDYARPLIGSPLEPYPRLAKVPVPRRGA